MACTTCAANNSNILTPEPGWLFSFTATHILIWTWFFFVFFLKTSNNSTRKESFSERQTNKPMWEHSRLRICCEGSWWRSSCPPCGWWHPVFAAACTGSCGSQPEGSWWCGRSHKTLACDCGCSPRDRDSLEKMTQPRQWIPGQTLSHTSAREHLSAQPVSDRSPLLCAQKENKLSVSFQGYDVATWGHVKRSACWLAVTVWSVVQYRICWIQASQVIIWNKVVWAFRSKKCANGILSTHLWQR